MVDIIDISHALTEVYEIAYACKNIVNGDVLRNKLVRSCTKSSLNFFLAVVLVEDVAKDRGSNTLVDAELQRVDIAVAFVFKVRLDIYRTVSYYLDNAFFGFEKDFHYTGLFDLLTEVGSNNGAFFRDDLACERVDDRSCELVTYYTVCNTELFVELVSSEAGEVISLCIKEQIVEVSFRRLDCGRLTRAQFLVHFEQGFFPVLGGIFLHYGLANALVISEQRKKLFIRTFAESTHESGCRYFSVLVYTNVEDIVAVHLVFEPRTAVRDHLRSEQLLTGLVIIKAKVNAGRTDELGNYDTLGTVYNECTAVCHKREIAHEDHALRDFTGLLIAKSRLHTERSRISYITLLALFYGVLGSIVDTVINETQNELAV